MKRILLLSSIVILSFIAGACAPASTQIQTEGAVEVLDPDDSTEKEESIAGVDESRLTGIIMPHHELAKELIESAWEEALKVEPDLIVLIGPDHPGLATHPLIWTERIETFVPFVVSPLAQVWIDAGLGGEAIVADHSIESLLKYLPEEAREIPVLAVTVPRGMESDAIDHLVEMIRESDGDRLQSGNRLLLVGSVDFSHGLKSEEAKAKDEESFQWIQNRNFDQIHKAGDEYFDSPETIEILLRCIEGDINQVKRSDSSDFGWGKELPGTSYQIIRVAQ